MAKVKFELGATIDALSPDEFHRGLSEHQALVAHQERERLRGAKIRRMPPMSGAAVGGVLDMGGDVPWPQQPGAAAQIITNPVGPPQGYGWWLRLLSVSGLTPGTTTDIVNVLINGQSSTIPWWQVNGNNFAFTFSRGEFPIMSGETLHFKSVGTFAATGQITVVGVVLQEPAEMMARV